MSLSKSVQYVALIALAVVLGSHLGLTAISLPDQLHAESEIYYRNSNTKTFSWYQVTEYVDQKGGRSSLQLIDIDDGTTTIYYNDLAPPGGSSRRKFIVYNVEKNICKSSSLNDWQLKKIRKFIIAMLPMEKLDRKTCDIALGPTGLLLGIEQSKEEFRFLRHDFSKVRLAKIDIYERIMNTEQGLSDENTQLLFTVRVVSQNKAVSKLIGTTLADTGDAKVEVLSLTICQLTKESLDKRAAGTEYECNDDELLLEIDYYVVAQRQVGTLVGRTLDESAMFFDYNSNPFMRPLGIGCWKDFDFANERKFIIPSLQFTAEYVTNLGSPEPNYVAYDGYRRLLRMDRDKRKSIYDLDRGLSYHSNIYNPNREIATDTSKSCIVLEITDRALSSQNTIERLLGVSGGSTTHFMGTKTIDHIAYDVFEAELAYDALSGSEIPIFMESAGFIIQYDGASTGDKSRARYFLTYYVHDDRETFEISGTTRDDFNQKTVDSSMAPKFVELWMVSGSDRRRTLINRLEFIEFAWSLEIQPERDPDTQDMSQIFYMKSCALSRTTEVQLRFTLTEDTDKGKRLSNTEVAAIRSNKQLIREVIQNNLAYAFDISRLQVANLEVAFLHNSANMLVETHLIELQAGVTADTMLGYGLYADIMKNMKDYVKSFTYNRHTLESCVLDSLAQPGTNSFIYCRGLTTCVVVPRDKVASIEGQLDHLEPMDVLRSSDPTMSKCEVHNYDWAPSITPKANQVSDKVGSSLLSLISRQFAVQFKYSEPNRPDRFAEFLGLSHNIKMKRIDSASLDNSNAPLVGLRHMTLQEDTDSRNLNVPVKLTQKPEDRFGYCQMACQFDEYCESFSVCVRRSAPIQHFDCVLSNMRLTEGRLDFLSRKIRASNSDEMDISATTHERTERFRFQKDPDCNIHPRDFLSSYQAEWTFQVTKPADLGSSKGSHEFDKVLSLEDCASQAFDEGQDLAEINSNFTYCPLSSTCLTNAQRDTIYQSAGAQDQICSLHTRAHAQFYSYRRNSHLQIIAEGKTEVDHNNLDQFTGLGRVIEGRLPEDCARDCNLHRSNCLSFDMCHRKEDKFMCILYSIRSPMSFAENKKLGLLPQEKRFYSGENSAKVDIQGHVGCHHYALRRGYFDIKLQQLLDRAEHEELPQRAELDRLEDAIIADDEERSEESMRQALEQAAGEHGSTSGPTGHPLLQLLLFLGGVGLGCFGFIRQTQGVGVRGIPVSLMDAWERIRVKFSQRYRNQRISQIEIANNIEAFEG